MTKARIATKRRITITVELYPHVAELLEKWAAARGMTLDEYANWILQQDADSDKF
ncbi:MAG TPA: hypothetical protein VFJ05_06955 [Nitrososphaeraceae archaeon]|nr:hypothetical protein [Nitrososphaeraceae archaeon]